MLHPTKTLTYASVQQGHAHIASTVGFEWAWDPSILPGAAPPAWP